MELRVPFPPNFKSIEDFNINQYVSQTYHNNKVTKKSVYYRCSTKSCPAKASATIRENFIEIIQKNVHSHPIEEDKGRKNNEEIRSFTRQHISEPPSKIQLQFIKSHEDYEIPPLAVFQNTKKNLLRGKV
jgi:hypothetical protein